MQMNYERITRIIYLTIIIINVHNMLLRYISLQINHPYLPDEECQRFIYNTGFLNNYLSRSVRKLKIETHDSFNLLGVVLCGEHKPDEFNPFFKVISIYDVLSSESWSQYQSLRIDGRIEYCLDILEKGYKRAACLKPIPVDRLIALHTTFRENDYRNEWLFKKRTLSKYGLTIYLKCYYTAFEFRLELEALAQHSNVLLCNGTLLRTPAFEEAFVHLLHDICINDPILEILDSSGFANITVDVSRLADGEFNYQYHDDERYKGKVWYKGWEKDIIENQRMIDKMTW